MTVESRLKKIFQEIAGARVATMTRPASDIAFLFSSPISVIPNFDNLSCLLDTNLLKPSIFPE